MIANGDPEPDYLQFYIHLIKTGDKTGVFKYDCDDFNIVLAPDPSEANRNSARQGQRGTRTPKPEGFKPKTADKPKKPKAGAAVPAGQSSRFTVEDTCAG
jgi:hypothetical protein